MWLPRVKYTILGLMIAVAVMALLFTSLSSLRSRWRESMIYEAIEQGSGPSFWWPPGWRQELRESLTLAGHLRSSVAGTLEFEAGTGGRVIRTPVSDGRYSLSPRLLPAGTLKVRFISPAGSGTSWFELGNLGPGRHRINLSFGRIRLRTTESGVNGEPWSARTLRGGTRK